MREGVMIALNTLRRVFPTRLPPALICAALLFAFLWKRKERRAGRVMAACAMLTGVLFLCPPFAVLMKPFMRGGEVYWRFLWIFPSTALVAYLCTELTSAPKRVERRALTGCLLAAALVLTGSSVYNGQVFQKAVNREKLPREAVTIVSVIDQNALETGNIYKKVVVPNPWTDEIRQIDGTIQHPFGMRIWFPVPEDPATQFDDFKRIVNGYEKDHDGILMFFLDRARINYIAAKDEYGFQDTLESGGYMPLYSGDDLTVYYNPDIQPGQKAK